MNITLSADQKLIEQARHFAKQHNTNLNKACKKIPAIPWLGKGKSVPGRRICQPGQTIFRPITQGIQIFQGPYIWSDRGRITKYFIDTNILFYANDARGPNKQNQAIQLVNRLMLDDTGVLSTQVMQEYAHVALNKLGQRQDVVIRQLFILETFQIIEKHPNLYGVPLK